LQQNHDQPPLTPKASDNAELDTVSDSTYCAENYYKNEGSSLKIEALLESMTVTPKKTRTPESGVEECGSDN
jgi:hypothetical protein